MQASQEMEILRLSEADLWLAAVVTQWVQRVVRSNPTQDSSFFLREKRVVLGIAFAARLCCWLDGQGWVLVFPYKHLYTFTLHVHTCTYMHAYGISR